MTNLLILHFHDKFLHTFFWHTVSDLMGNCLYGKGFSCMRHVWTESRAKFLLSLIWGNFFLDFYSVQIVFIHPSK